ncbi:MAG TPA: hypothetical protein VNG13_07295 [Mycobacteriales bacterium]|nr:hypothetical protein [Mycobacteriales bacterium]
MFLVAFGLAAVVRGIAMFAYRPVLWFNGDSFEYMAVAHRLRPYRIRPDGYPAFLRLLQPLPHDLAVVAGLQHAMGLAVAALLYALMRRHGLPGWGATLAVLPVLFDAYQIELEHLAVSDLLAMLVGVAALVLALWWRRPPFWAAALVGLLLAAALLVRTATLPVVGLVMVFLLARRIGWRRFAVAGAALVLPLTAYAGWFDASNGSFRTLSSDGIFLYSRVQTFATCPTLHLPAVDRILCNATPVAQRPSPEWYIWHSGSPLYRLPGATFSNGKNALALSFAEHAIEQHPLTYLRTSWSDVWRAFRVHRTTFPNAITTEQYSFSYSPTEIPMDRVYVPPDTAFADTTWYAHGTPPVTRVNHALAAFLIRYQRWIALPGPLLGVLFVIAGLGIAVGWRDRTSWTCATVLGLSAAALLAMPALTAEFDYRYVLPVVPLISVAAAFAVKAIASSHRRDLRSGLAVGGPAQAEAAEPAEV